MTAQYPIDFTCKPGIMAELEYHFQPTGSRNDCSRHVQKCTKSRVISAEGSRELKQNRPQMGSERSSMLKKQAPCLFDIDQPLDMSNEPARLDGENEIIRN